MKTFPQVFNFIIVTFAVVSCGNDGSGSYEFGFTIDGQQHRQEKKDVNGIIQGEFGFITADGIYHVTVYATDENGNFRILSMRNVRISAPLDGSPLPPGAKIESLPNQKSPVQPNAPPTPPPSVPQVTTQHPKAPFPFTTQPTIKPACGGCGYVTTAKPKPGQSPFNFQTPALQNNPVNPGSAQQVSNPANPQTNYPGIAQSQPNNYPGGSPGVNGQRPPVTGNYPANPQPNYPNQGNSNYPGGSPGQNPQSNYPDQGNSNYPGGSPGQIPQSNYPDHGGISYYPGGLPGQNPPTSYPDQGGNLGSNEYPQSPAGGIPPHSNYPGSNYPGTSVNPQAPVPASGNYPGAPGAVYPGGGNNPGVPGSPLSQVSVSGGTIHVPGNPDIPIKDKFPGMVDGLPAGIQEKDISDLLYKFNYTVGFHGHYEKGLKNGAKVGGYFVNGRDGVSRIVTYVADENGFRPKVKFIRLDLNSDEVPKEGSEKTFGLKSFEFVWYPVK